MGTACGSGFSGWLVVVDGLAGTMRNLTLDGGESEFSVTSMGRLTTGVVAESRGSTTCTASQGVRFSDLW